MRIKMKDTTRHQRYPALIAGNVYEVDDETGAHLVQQRLAVGTKASVTDDDSLDDPDQGAPAAGAEGVQAEGNRGGMVTREGAAPLAGEGAPAAPRGEQVISGPTTDDDAPSRRRR